MDPQTSIRQGDQKSPVTIIDQSLPFIFHGLLVECQGKINHIFDLMAGKLGQADAWAAGSLFDQQPHPGKVNVFDLFAGDIFI